MYNSEPWKSRAFHPSRILAMLEGASLQQTKNVCDHSEKAENAPRLKRGSIVPKRESSRKVWSSFDNIPSVHRHCRTCASKSESDCRIDLDVLFLRTYNVDANGPQERCIHIAPNSETVDGREILFRI